jgi:peptidoglycan/xylan/chitin deacetylase (PgdA/CDA1 family)
MTFENGGNNPEFESLSTEDVSIAKTLQTPLRESKSQYRSRRDSRDTWRYVGAVWENFEDLSNWSAPTGTLSAETTDQYMGTQCAAISESGQTRTLIRQQFAGADLSGNCISLAVKVRSPDPADLDDVIVRFDIVDTSGNQLGGRAKVRKYSFDEWVRFDIAPLVDKSADATSVDYVDVRFDSGDGSTQSWDILVDDIRFIDRPSDGYVILSFDDGDESVINTAAPIMDEYGYPGVAFVNPPTIGTSGRLSQSDLDTLQSRGWDISSHTEDGTPLPNKSASEQRADIKSAKAWLLNNGFRSGARLLAYVGGAYTASIQDLADEYHSLSFQTTTEVGSASPKTLSAAQNVLRRSGEISLSDNQNAIDTIDSRGGVCTFNFHEVGTGPSLSLSESDFRSTIEYIDGKDNVEVITATDLIGWQ